MGFGHFLRIVPFGFVRGVVGGVRERDFPDEFSLLLPVGQAMIGLRDVAYLLGLRVHGEPLTGETFSDYRSHWKRVFGRLTIPPSSRGRNDKGC